VTALVDEKLADYRQTGVRLIWVIEPSSRTVDGGDVLPGFAVPVGRLFADI
jgi:hypothetical protein